MSFIHLVSNIMIMKNVMCVLIDITFSLPAWKQNSSHIPHKWKAFFVRAFSWNGPVVHFYWGSWFHNNNKNWHSSGDTSHEDGGFLHQGIPFCTLHKKIRFPHRILQICLAWKCSIMNENSSIQISGWGIFFIFLYLWVDNNGFE